MTSATERIRAMLDERGVEWWQKKRHTCWKVSKGQEVEMWRAWEAPDGSLTLKVDYIYGMTPEQAIAATLGATDAKPTQEESSGTCEADETDTWECVRDDLGGYGKTMTVHVMECTECGHVYEHVNGDYEYCPRCGRKRRDVEE